MPSHATIDQNAARRQAAIDFLLGRIDYERARNVPYRKQEFKLQRMRELVERIGNPHMELPIVHVAGTKGKGSTAAMIGAVLSAAGFRTGLFTSPHLERIEQRMAVADRPCPTGEFVELVDLLRPAVEAMDRQITGHDADEIGPTYFEITTAMAMLHFAREKVDAAVLEVGLGGRLDSTNICQPLVSVITSISYDHTKQLGTTLRSIAREKAGIIKPGMPVVSGVTQPEPRAVIRETCRRQDCRLVELGVDFDFEYRPPRHLERSGVVGRLDFRHQRGGPSHRDLPLGLLGDHQASNAAVALATLVELQRTGREIPEQAVRSGLQHVVCPARVEVVDRRPAVVVDTAHNRASIEALIRVLDESFSVDRRLLIFAATEDKDVGGMLDCVLTYFDHVVLTRYLDNPRAMRPEKLAAMADELTDSRYTVCDSPAEAWDEVRRLAEPQDLICVAGSVFIAAELRRTLVAQPPTVPTETRGPA